MPTTKPRYSPSPIQVRDSDIDRFTYCHHEFGASTSSAVQILKCASLYTSLTYQAFQSTLDTPPSPSAPPRPTPHAPHPTPTPRALTLYIAQLHSTIYIPCDKQANVTTSVLLLQWSSPQILPAQCPIDSPGGFHQATVPRMHEYQLC